MERRRRERAEQVAYKLEREIATWDPNQLLEATEDPFKTLFVARIVGRGQIGQFRRGHKAASRSCFHFTPLQNYDTSESKLRREFEIYGNIKKIIMINDKDTGKPRGYAFIEYEHERDMHGKYRELNTIEPRLPLPLPWLETAGSKGGIVIPCIPKRPFPSARSSIHAIGV